MSNSPEPSATSARRQLSEALEKQRPPRPEELAGLTQLYVTQGFAADGGLLIKSLQSAAQQPADEALSAFQAVLLALAETLPAEQPAAGDLPAERFFGVKKWLEQALAAVRPEAQALQALLALLHADRVLRSGNRRYWGRWAYELATESVRTEAAARQLPDWAGLRRDAFGLAAAEARARGGKELAFSILRCKSWPGGVRARLIRCLWQQSNKPWKS